jgi:hypothetical protein
MSYIVNRTDGNIAAVVNDGVIDTTTSLNLVGKGTSNYAETVAEDLIALLENHASILAPRRPLPGQIWFNKAERQLKVYDENKQQFTVVNNAAISATAPANPFTGDMWYNSDKKQLYFYRGNFWQIVAPAYADNQGRSELVVETIKNIQNIEHTVITFYVNNKRAVVISSNAEFDPYPAMPGFEKVYPGINIATVYSGINDAKLNGTSLFSNIAYSLDAVADATYMHANADTSTVGNLSVLNNSFSLGVEGNLFLSATNGVSLTANANVDLTINGYGGSTLTFDNATNRISINKTSPTTELDVGGSINADGDIKTGGRYYFGQSYIEESDSFETDNNVVINAGGINSLSINSDGSLKVTNQLRADNILIQNNSTFNGNVNIATLPTQTSHSANKRYVDALVTYNTLPIGSVIMWYGDVIDIPEGWSVCNGANGTPDLRDRFIMGAGSSAMGGQTDTFANGVKNFASADTSTIGDHVHTGTNDLGGIHNHDGFVGGHVLTTSEIPEHSHTFTDIYGLRDDAYPPVYDRNGNRLQGYTGWGDDGDNDSGAGIFRDWQTDLTGSSNSHNHTIGNSTAHTHTFTADPGGAHKHTVSFDNRPSWIALYFIMKTSNVLSPPNF